MSLCVRDPGTWSRSCIRPWPVGTALCFVRQKSRENGSFSPECPSSSSPATLPVSQWQFSFSFLLAKVPLSCSRLISQGLLSLSVWNVLCYQVVTLPLSPWLTASLSPALLSHLWRAMKRLLGEETWKEKLRNHMKGKSLNSPVWRNRTQQRPSQRTEETPNNPSFRIHPKLKLRHRVPPQKQAWKVTRTWWQAEAPLTLCIHGSQTFTELVPSVSRVAQPTPCSPGWDTTAPGCSGWSLAEESRPCHSPAATSWRAGGRWAFRGRCCPTTCRRRSTSALWWWGSVHTAKKLCTELWSPGEEKSWNGDPINKYTGRLDNQRRRPHLRPGGGVSCLFSLCRQIMNQHLS